METQVGKWGNSLGIRIPAVLARELGLTDGCEVDLTLVRGGLLLKKPSRHSLEELLSKITPENRHEEFDWGGPQGAESW